MSIHGAASFAAMEAIQRGDWDAHLLQLRAAVHRRIAETAAAVLAEGDRHEFAPDLTMDPVQATCVLTGADGTICGNMRYGDYRHLPARRLASCVRAWQDCEDGEYNPACCRFPKSCSARSYDYRCIREGDLEPRG